MVVTLQQAAASTSPVDVIAIVTNQSIQSDRTHVLVMDASVAPRNVRIAMYGADCHGLIDVNVGDVLKFHDLQLVSTRDSDVLYDFKRATTYETDQPAWVRLTDRGSCMDRNENNDAAQALQLINWYNETNPLTVESLPCRRRQLQEIQTVGLISHVQVRVIAVEAAPVRQRLFRKRKRLTSAPTWMIATLLDDHGDVASLVDCQGWQVALKDAMTRGELVQISHVRSIPSADEGDSSVSLTPTASTAIVNCPTFGNLQKKLPQTTQTQELSILSPNRVMMTIRASVDRIYIPELCTELERKHFLSPSAFAAIMVNQETKSFRAILLTLNETQVWASSEIVQVLCGSVEAKDVSLHVTTRRNVLELIRGLLDDGVELQWTVEKEAGEDYRVSSVSLPDFLIFNTLRQMALTGK
jgi:hypothetical protein